MTALNLWNLLIISFQISSPRLLPLNSCGKVVQAACGGTQVAILNGQSGFNISICVLLYSNTSWGKDEYHKSRPEKFKWRLNFIENFLVYQCRKWCHFPVVPHVATRGIAHQLFFFFVLKGFESCMNFSIWNQKATVFPCQIKEKCLFGDTGFLEKALNCQNQRPQRWFRPRSSDGRSSIPQLPSPESGVDSTISPQWQVRSSLTNLPQILFWGLVVLVVCFALIWGSAGLASSSILTLYFSDRGELFVWGKNIRGCLGIGKRDDQYFPWRVRAQRLVPAEHRSVLKPFALNKQHTLPVNSKTGILIYFLSKCNSSFIHQVTVPGQVVDVTCGVDHMVALVKSLLWGWMFMHWPLLSCRGPGMGAQSHLVSAGLGPPPPLRGDVNTSPELLTQVSQWSCWSWNEQFF